MLCGDELWLYVVLVSAELHPPSAAETRNAGTSSVFFDMAILHGLRSQGYTFDDMRAKTWQTGSGTPPQRSPMSTAPLTQGRRCLQLHSPKVADVYLGRHC